MSHENINYVYRNFASNLRLHGSELLAKIHIGRISQPFGPMLITQDKMEKPLMVRSRFRLVSSSSPVLLVLKCLPFFKMADDESKINTSLSFLLTTSCSFQAFKNNSARADARADVWTLIEGIEMIFSFQFKLQLLFPQMRLVDKLLHHISNLVRAL